MNTQKRKNTTQMTIERTPEDHARFHADMKRIADNAMRPAEVTQDLAPDGLPWIIREPNKTTPHADNGWQFHYPR